MYTLILNNCVPHSQSCKPHPSISDYHIPSMSEALAPMRLQNCLGNYSQLGPAFIADYRNSIIPRLRLHGALLLQKLFLCTDASARAASFGLHLELAWPTLTIFTTMIMCMRYELVNMWTTYCYIHTNIHTYIHKYSDFLISVGVAQAHPNNSNPKYSFQYLLSGLVVSYTCKPSCH